MGWGEAKLYVSHFRVPCKLRTSNHVFRFGDNLVHGEETMRVRMPVPGHEYLPLKCLVFKTYIPFYLGLDALRLSGLTLGLKANSLSSLDPPCAVPLA